MRREVKERRIKRTEEIVLKLSVEIQKQMVYFEELTLRVFGVTE
jgi:hypothetical protein